MAACIKCEKCGAIVSFNEAVHIRAHKFTDASSFRTKPEDFFDVCKNCYDGLVKVLEHKEKDK